MKKYKFLSLLLSISACVPFSSARTILTSQARQDYEMRLSLQPQLKDKLVIPDGLNPEEREALTFLFAYLPTPDLLDYDLDFYLQNIRGALKADQVMPWGNNVPDREWRHFVLPVRVNNENLDLSRKLFFDELKSRVEGLSMKEAILEVNHWCHEKVSYQPSDARTSSPLVTMANALGRCGEESTFTVAALRSIGIPARQVYTPRWAHTDDNHAWVEAWADGKWYFLGACEPEPVLNLAWFNDPASRGMLMNTKVTGKYDGPEEALDTTPITTVINVTENYAPIAITSVTVLDDSGNPRKDIKVRFLLYNYGEYYSLAEKTTDDDGYASLTSGRGDMIVWASDGKDFNFTPVRAGTSISLTLDKDSSFTGAFDFNLVPPIASSSLPQVNEEDRALNDIRKAKEDSIRLSYVNSFLSPEQAGQFCNANDIPPHVAEYIVKARGNQLTILEALAATPIPSQKRLIDLLSTIAEKDLHDISHDVIRDNVYFSMGDENSKFFIPYILNPRIENEMLRPYKENIQKSFSEKQIKNFQSDPGLIAAYLKDKTVEDNLFNPGGFRQSSTSTLRHHTADSFNRSIAFVAICRALGIPARIDPVTHTTQYASADEKWHNVFLPAQESENKNTGTILHIDNKSDNIGREPKYYSQFTLSKIVDGFPLLMEFDDFETLESINARKQTLSPGQYILTSGQRLADGGVLARSEVFYVKGEPKVTPTLIVRNNSDALQVIGNLNAELTYAPFIPTHHSTNEAKTTILSTVGRGYYVLGFISPGHEPSSHALNDIAQAADRLEATGRKLLLLFPDKESAQKFRIEDYGALPSNVYFGIDDGRIAQALLQGMEWDQTALSSFPIFVVADSFNRIVFASKGYTINLGDKLADILNQVK